MYETIFAKPWPVPEAVTHAVCGLYLLTGGTIPLNAGENRQQRFEKGFSKAKLICGIPIYFDPFVSVIRKECNKV